LTKVVSLTRDRLSLFIGICTCDLQETMVKNKPQSKKNLKVITDFFIKLT